MKLTLTHTFLRRMKRPLWAALVLAVAWGTGIAPPISAKATGPDEPYGGKPLCLPAVYRLTPADCLPLGPSQTLTELAENGQSNPSQPFQVIHPGQEWIKSPVSIAKINGDPTKAVPLYASLADAKAGRNPIRTIAPGSGLHYVSTVQVVRVGSKAFVQLKSGEWTRASPAAYSSFQGLLFSQAPTNAFGWVIDTIRARAKPSFTAAEVGELIIRETPVPIFEIVEQEGMEWYRIGENQWVPYLKARRARVDPNPPKGVKGDRWISVDLYDQVVMVYQDRRLIFATLVSTGAKPYYTRPGVFQIYQKKPLETMTGAFEPNKSDYYYLEDVPWTMYFDQARALHGAYWRPWFGVAGTHGCVNFSLGDANWLYQWAKPGDWVYVWDASGQTPTDPKLYGAGGA